MKAPSYINDAIIENNLNSMKYYDTLVDIIDLCHSVTIDVALLPVQSHASYGTWSIDFVINKKISLPWWSPIYSDCQEYINGEVHKF